MEDGDDFIKLEDTTYEEDDSKVTRPKDIFAFNELRSCADIFRMVRMNQLKIDPDFQREDVWTSQMKTRFIDSLYNELPIPSMCISLDVTTDSRIVIDGRQRIGTIIEFLNEESEMKLSKLTDIDNRLSGSDTKTLRTKYPKVVEKIENISIPITVLRCDTSKKPDMEYLFTVFHRLNTGGTKLSNQEIRNGIYGSDFNNFLKETAKNSNVISVLGYQRRYGTEEAILRVLAFQDKLTSYQGRLAKFLNDYMDSGKKMTTEEIQMKRDYFTKAVNLVCEKLKGVDTVKTLSRTAREGLVYGVITNLENLTNKSNSEFKAIYTSFTKLPQFSKESLKEGLSTKVNVTNRLNAAREIFSR